MIDRHRRQRAVAIGLAVGASVLIGVQSPVGASERPMLTTPESVSGASLAAVDGVDTNNLWAVGFRWSSGARTPAPLIVHFDGQTWHPVPTPSLEGELSAVAAVSRDDVWAVGSITPEDGSQHALIEHWDGTRWRQSPVPEFGLPYDSLTTIGVRTADDVIATGVSAGSVEGPYKPLSLHWDGLHWAETAAKSRTIASVDGASARDAWAVGSTHSGLPLARHWDGRHWSPVELPRGSTSGALSLVSVGGGENAWAVGWTNEGSSALAVADHWNGRRWVVAADGLHTRLTSAAGLSVAPDGAAWTVLDVARGSGLFQWNGSTWVAATPPRAGGGGIHGVKAFGAGDVWAVGARYHCPQGGGACTDRRVIRHWDGVSWQFVQ